ncbi:DNAdirected RNA polymerase alpha subunit EC 2776 [Bradyrhizobium sp.]|nr:DNA-directed RNA polymerase subunit alpha C-terminal domain-containing protein [Bradyrhizobium sp.]CUT14813.1 DNAdirected RNA polymerase alpha subunit EC 2776 [Bradyrhizobium sp.]CUT14821.1 DNAdirected RNA polymerase alpha subunit EC 2776 [Bradyrhizobium sp.]
MQNRKYGGFADWEVLYHFWVNDGAGRIEHEARALLQAYKTMRYYEKDGRAQKAREILKCAFSIAHEALLRAVGHDERSEEWQSDRVSLFEFGGASPKVQRVAGAAKPLSPGEMLFSTRLLQPLDQLELSFRASNCLRSENIVYVGDLVGKTEDQLRKIPSLSHRAIIEVKELLEGMGLHLGMEVLGWPPADAAEISVRFQQMLLIKVDELEFPVRTANCLRNEGITYVRDLIQRTEAELICSPFLGSKSVEQIKWTLGGMGLKLGMDVF